MDFSGDHPYPVWLATGSREGFFGNGRTLYRHGWQIAGEQWEGTAREYESSPDDFHSAWHYLDGHPIFWKFKDQDQDQDPRPPNNYALLEKGESFARMSIDVFVTRTGEDGVRSHDDQLNTRTEVWLEAGKWDLLKGEHVHAHWHDIDLDTGAATYEKAVCKLAWLVWDKYGNDRRVADAPILR